MLSKRVKYLLIALVALLALALSSYLYFVKYKKLDLETIIVGFAESKIDGNIILTKFRWSLANSRLSLAAEHLSIVDAAGNLFLEADKPIVVLRWHNLFSFNPLKNYHLLAAAYSKLYLERDLEGRWNYQKIFRSRDKQKPIQIEQAQLPRLDIEIRDALYPDRKIAYSDMKVIWAKQGLKRVYTVDIDSGKTSLNNHASLQGSMATGSLEHILRQHFDLSFDIENITPEDFAPILHIAGFDQDQIALISRLGKLSLKGKWGYFGAKLLKLDAELALHKDSLNFSSKIYGDFKTTRGETYMNWQLVTARFNLPAWLDVYARSFAQYPVKGLEQYPRAAQLMASKLRIIHPQEYTVAKLIARGTVNKPEFKADIQLVDSRGALTYYPGSTEPKTIAADFSVQEEKTIVPKLIIPLNYASLILSGWITRDLAFDFALQSKGITLTQLKALILDLPYATVYQDMIRRLELSGLAALDLRVTRPAPNKDIKVIGEAQLAKVNIFHPDYPVALDNVFATVDLKNDKWELTKLTGYFGGDYFEAAGTLGLDPDPSKAKIALKVALPKLDLAKLVQSRFLTLFALDRYIKSASGIVSELMLDIRDVPQQSQSTKRYYRLLGNFDLNNISLNDFNRVNGQLVFLQEGLKINNLVFAVGEGRCALNGRLKQSTDNGAPIWLPDLDFIADKLELSKAKSIIDTFIQIKTPDETSSDKLRFADFEIFDGIINANLHIDSVGAVGKVSFTQLNFQYDPLITPFREASGTAVIAPDRTLTINSLSGLYGASNFKASGKIKNLFINKTAARKLEYQMKVNGDFFMPELTPLFPKVINRYCTFKGRMPVKLNLSGNRTKTNIETEAEISALDKFNYFGWLDIDPSYKSILKVKFVVTPELINSEHAELLVYKPGASDPNPAVLNGIFNIKDYRDPKAISYYTKFETKPLETHLGYIGAHIFTLRPFAIRYGDGKFNCVTHGSSITQQTNCDFNFNDATIAKFGIGDLNANTIVVKLFSVSNQPLETRIRAAAGDWNTVPFTKLSLEMSSNGTSITTRNIKANIGQGSVESEFKLVYENLASTFTIKGQSLPAHDVAQGLWGLGAEVPEGLVDINFVGKTKGIEQDDIFYNLIGTAEVMVKNGKLSQLKSMQRLLSAVNGVMSFDLNNVAQSLINYQGGLFDYIIFAMDYNLGVMSTKRLLLKAPQMEMLLKGKADYNTDYLDIDGMGLIPKHEKSLLDKVGIGPISLGNALSLFKSGDKSKRYFSFKMVGPISNQELTNKSIQESFRWLEEVPQGEF